MLSESDFGVTTKKWEFESHILFYMSKSEKSLVKLSS